MALSAYTLFSSSSGNSSYFTDGKTSFLIDAGGSGKRLCAALSVLGVSPCDIEAVFITHEHTDHTAGIKGFCRKNSPVIHAVSLSADNIDAQNVKAHERIYAVRLGDFLIKSFATSHDSRCSVGYVIEHESGIKLGTLTDTGYVSDDMAYALEGCSAVILESNYDEEMLRYGGYPADLKRRIASERGHLSNRQCAEFLPHLYENGTRRVLLAHISPENNTPELAQRSALDAIERFDLTGLEAEPAKRFEITKLI